MKSFVFFSGGYADPERQAPPLNGGVQGGGGGSGGALKGLPIANASGLVDCRHTQKRDAARA